MVVFDSSVLLLVLDPNAKAPNDPATGKPVEKAAKRIEYLIENLKGYKETIIIPTPVLSEVLVHAGEATNDYLHYLNSRSVFEIVNFDQMAAMEAAIAMKDAINRGGHRVDTASPNTTKTKIKFDRQIFAIAKVKAAHAIYSDDEDIHNYARHAQLDAYRIADLDLPPEDPQQEFEL